MDYYRPEIPSPEKKEHHLFRTLVISALFLILIAVLGSLLSSRLPGRWSGPGRLVEAHIKAINSGDFRSAYTHFTAQYRDQVSFQEFHSGFGDFTDQLPCRSLKINRVEAGSKQAVVEGILTGNDGTIVPIYYDLVKEKGEWRIRNFQWIQPGELISL
jgi:hypothetical protein